MEKRDRSLENMLEDVNTDDIIRRAGYDPNEVNFDELNRLMMLEHIKRIYEDYFKFCKQHGVNGLEYGDTQVYIAADELCKVASLMYGTRSLSELGEFMWHVIKACPEQIAPVFQAATKKLFGLISMHVYYLEGEGKGIEGHSPFNFFLEKMREHGMLSRSKLQDGELPSEALEVINKVAKKA